MAGTSREHNEKMRRVRRARGWAEHNGIRVIQFAGGFVFFRDAGVFEIDSPLIMGVLRTVFVDPHRAWDDLAEAWNYESEAGRKL